MRMICKPQLSVSGPCGAGRCSAAGTQARSSPAVPVREDGLAWPADDMQQHTYRKIAEKNDVEEGDDAAGWRKSAQNARDNRKQRSIIVLLSVILLISLSMNAHSTYRFYFQRERLYNDLPSQYANLRRTQEYHMVPDSDFTSPNRTVQDAAWESKRMESWRMFVALDDEYSTSKGLPHSMRWPWDLDKGVYILNAAHELHCVKVIRSFVVEKNDGVADEDLVWNFGHASHCLNELRQSVMCNADDMPLYTGRLNANVDADEVVNGRGMTRMCRDWDALMDWADERSACYLSRDNDRKDESFDELDRYKHCPGGARPWEDL